MEEQTPRALSRRQVLARLGSAAAGLVAIGPAGAGYWRSPSFLAAGRAFDVAAAALGPNTLRITLLPPATPPGSNPVPLDGALVPTEWTPGKLLNESAGTVPVGDFRVSITATPLTIRVTRPDGRLV